MQIFKKVQLVTGNKIQAFSQPVVYAGMQAHGQDIQPYLLRIKQSHQLIIENSISPSIDRGGKSRLKKGLSESVPFSIGV